MFIEDKIRKYGVGAENLAKSLISEYGINDITDTEFEQRLKGRPINPKESYEGFKITERDNTRK